MRRDCLICSELTGQRSVSSGPPQETPEAGPRPITPASGRERDKTDRQTDRGRHRQTDIERARQTERERERARESERERERASGSERERQCVCERERTREKERERGCLSSGGLPDDAHHNLIRHLEHFFR